jgi:Fe-S-cluster containining protein
VSAGCAGCGDCCERIWLNTDPRPWSTAALAGVPDPRTDDGWAYWLENVRQSDRPLTEADRETVLRSYDPAGTHRANADFVAAHFAETCDGHWTCDAYDPEHGACTVYEDRPPLCAGFPWYAEGPVPDPRERLPRRCSYLADLPPADRGPDARPLIPLAVAGVS